MSLTLQYAFTSHPSFEEDGDADALRIEVGCAPPSFQLGDQVDAERA
ncbi:MAG: hypothetical protein II515_01470 [Desulfovibrio sp.]|nr:hypothetical protein [Desulfovibrio sp.]